MVPEDTIPTNVYMSNYLSHRTVQYDVHSLSDHSREQFEPTRQ